MHAGQTGICTRRHIRAIVAFGLYHIGAQGKNPLSGSRQAKKKPNREHGILQFPMLRCRGYLPTTCQAALWFGNTFHDKQAETTGH